MMAAQYTCRRTLSIVHPEHAQIGIGIAIGIVIETY